MLVRASRGGEGILLAAGCPGEQRDDPDGAEAAATARPSAAEPGVTLARTRSAISEPWLIPPTLVAEATSSGRQKRRSEWWGRRGVADEVHLLRPCDGEHLLHLLEQLFTAQLRALGGGDLGHMDLGAIPGQGLGMP